MKGKKRAGREGEDELQEDVFLMLKIMTNLISKDFLDFSDDSGWWDHFFFDLFPFSHFCFSSQVSLPKFTFALTPLSLRFRTSSFLG